MPLIIAMSRLHTHEDRTHLGSLLLQGHNLSAHLQDMPNTDRVHSLIGECRDLFQDRKIFVRIQTFFSVLYLPKFVKLRASRALKIDTLLRQYPLLIGMLDLAHLGHQISIVD